MKQKNIFWGIVLLFGGIALIVDKLGYFGDVNAFSKVLTIFLIAIMIKSIFKARFAGILFPIAFICILFDDKLGITSITPWTVLIAAALGSLGLSMIFHNKRNRYFNNHHDWVSKMSNIEYEEDENSIKLNTCFGSSTKNINNSNLEKIYINCRFGNMEIYFDNTILKNGHSTVILDTAFSNVELYIPKSWTVENKATTSFGELDEKNRNISTPENILTIIGNINFAVVDIIYI